MRTIDPPTTLSPDRDRPAQSTDRELIATIVNQVESSLRHLRCAAAERLVRQGISMTHLHVLWQLEEHGELGMGRIAELTGVSMSNATGLIDRMEERGLVERARLTDDRRAVHVRPTPRGLEVLREIEILRGDLMEAVLSSLDDAQLARVARAMSDIRSVLLADPGMAGGEPGACERSLASDDTHRTQQTPASRADGMEYTTR
jgi:DNA-binding MarR family transcriptional regulator